MIVVVIFGVCIVAWLLFDLFVLAPVPKLGPFGPPCQVCGQRARTYHAGLGLIGVHACKCEPREDG